MRDKTGNDFSKIFFVRGPEMPDHLAGEVTHLLDAVRAGETGAQDRLFALVYDELYRLAADLMQQERADHTLEPAALLNEAYLRLLGQDALAGAPNRRYFFAAAARAMRQVLVEHARRRAAEKRGGAQQRLPLDAVLDHFRAQHLDVLRVHEALEQLAALHARQSQVVLLRFFGGCTLEEVAEQLGVSVATVQGDFRLARAWLRQHLEGDDS
jgi:RNA polymerase sigma factor (TIGR02999 family)